MILGIIVAMEVEASPLLDTNQLHKEVCNDFIVYHNKKNVIIISGVGTINSTLATYVLIHKFKCSKIINYGVAGFTGKKFKQCTLFSIEKVYKRDVDFSALGYDRYHFPDKKAYIKLETDVRLQIIDCYTSDEYIGPNSVVPDNVLVDMESYCIAYVCEKYHVPCVIYKSISDQTTDSDVKEQIEKYLFDAIEVICKYINTNIINI